MGQLSPVVQVQAADLATPVAVNGGPGSHPIHRQTHTHTGHSAIHWTLQLQPMNTPAKQIHRKWNTGRWMHTSLSLYLSPPPPSLSLLQYSFLFYLYITSESLKMHYRMTCTSDLRIKSYMFTEEAKHSFLCISETLSDSAFWRFLRQRETIWCTRANDLRIESYISQRKRNTAFFAYQRPLSLLKKKNPFKRQYWHIGTQGSIESQVFIHRKLNTARHNTSM